MGDRVRTEDWKDAKAPEKEEQTAGEEVAHPPVIHVDSSEPLISDRTGELITDKLWGIYFKRDKRGVQGGAVPENLGTEVHVDPYGPASPHYTLKEDFVDYWTAVLAHCMRRFAGGSAG